MIVSSCKVVQACTDNSPYEGPFKEDAPSWCQAPFEPEGILRCAPAFDNVPVYAHAFTHDAS
ncbi:hypothetical protein ACLOJK_017856 [Asimina triloba]